MSIFGLKIFIATSLSWLELTIVAKCTCAIDAAAIGSDKFLIWLKYFSPSSFFKIFLLELITAVPFKLTASQITWAVGSSYHGTFLIVLKSGLRIISISVFSTFFWLIKKDICEKWVSDFPHFLCQ